MIDCDALGDDLSRGNCQRVFFDATECRTQPLDPEFATVAACEAFRIGDWACDELNVGCLEVEEPEEDEADEAE
jgi:hypothetical protein